jgi:hypothetical protein
MYVAVVKANRPHTRVTSWLQLASGGVGLFSLIEMMLFHLIDDGAAGRS